MHETGATTLEGAQKQLGSSRPAGTRKSYRERSQEGTEAHYRHEADVVIYTDGSAAAGTSKGGAGVVVTRGDPENPTVVTEMKIKSKEMTSSYEEEREAMLSAAELIRNAEDDIRKVLICADSQSLVQSLNNKSEDTDELRTNLENA